MTAQSRDVPTAGSTAAAHLLAARAAEGSGVQLRELADLADLEAVYELFDRIWRPDKSNPPVTIEQLRALTHAGNYLAGAYDGDSLVGACVGFFAAPAGVSMHSHVAGVGATARGRSVGFALKLHQRAWALDRGLSEVTWTYDPLVRRNAYFNLVKLGARPREYLVDFYGEMADAINGGQGSDRVLVAWDLLAPRVLDICAGRRRELDADQLRAAGAVPALYASESGGPVVVPASRWRSAAVALVGVPVDVEGMRARDPVLAQDWRRALRAVLGAAIGEGQHSVVGFCRSGWYVVEREH